MAGSINLSLSQQFDKLNGKLLSGGRLYFYAAGTDSPQDAFKDDGLSLVHPNPIILAGDGRIPQLYFADGSIHVRLTDNAGVVQFDEDFVLVIGPSSGGGGGGGSSVDPNAIFQTGMMDWQPIQGERSGWVRCNGGTIGNNSSGAIYHALECQALYEHLFANYTDEVCPIEGGSIARSSTTATAAYSGAKKITLLDFREIIPAGLSDMGNVARSGVVNFSSVGVERGSRTTPAGIIGEITHLLAAVEMPSHDHPGNVTDPNNADHVHQVPGPAGTSASATGQATTGGSFWYGGIGGSLITSGFESNTHAHSFATGFAGSSQPHNTTPRIMLGTFYMKL